MLEVRINVSCRSPVWGGGRKEHREREVEKPLSSCIARCTHYVRKKGGRWGLPQSFRVRLLNEKGTTTFSNRGREREIPKLFFFPRNSSPPVGTQLERGPGKTFVVCGTLENEERGHTEKDGKGVSPILERRITNL